MIRITLIRVGGTLIGKTASDRWNLLALGVDYVITDDRNQAIVKRLRREFGVDFTFTVARNDSVAWHASDAEHAALGSKIGKVAA
jgi:hypothetical protein